jgi:predicted nucleotidyltransferase
LAAAVKRDLNRRPRSRCALITSNAGGTSRSSHRRKYRLLLFGSRARGEARPDSDLDLLVIEPGEVAKTARLKRELRGLEVALDVIVVSAKQAEEWGHFNGTVLNEALSEGRILVDA